MIFPFNLNKNKKIIITSILLGGSLIFLYNNYTSIVNFIYLLTYEQ